MVPFDELDEEDAIRSIWKLTLPDVLFNRARWKAFAAKRIVCDGEKDLGRDPRRLQQFLQTEAEKVILPPLVG